MVMVEDGMRTNSVTWTLVEMTKLFGVSSRPLGLGEFTFIVTQLARREGVDVMCVTKVEEE